MENQVLFHRIGCPFSAKVRDYIEEEGLREDIEYRDIEEDPAAEDELIRLSGDKQVPCLVSNGKPLLESDAIIAWLEANGRGNRRAAS